MTRKAFGCLSLALLVLAAAGPAAAHGILKRATPRPGASLDSPPSMVTLVFTEPVDGVYSSATVIDAAGRAVSGRAEVSSDGLTMTVPLAAETGIFRVRWRVLSRLDGHTTTGRFRFTVQAPIGSDVPVTPVPPGLPPGDDGDTVTGPAGAFDTARAVMRWVGLVAVLLAAGTAVFVWVVLKPLDSGTSSAGVGRQDLERMLRPLVVASAVVMVLASIAEFLLQAASLLDLPVSQLPASGLLGSMLLDTKAGWSTLAKVILAVAFLIPATPRGRVFRMSLVIWFGVVATVFGLLASPGVTAGSRHLEHLVALLLVATVYGLITAVGALILPLVPDLKLPEGSWALPVAGIMAVGAITINSHAAGRGPFAAAVDWVHLVAAAAWVGGLVPLSIVLARTPAGRRGDLARRIVPQFSRVAGWSLATLVVTGTFSAWLHIPALRAFVATLYGRALLIKLVLVLLVVALGAVNRFVMRPRIEAGANGTVRRGFLRNLSAEALLGAGILLAVAVLTITPPAIVSFPAAARPALRLAALTDDQRVVLEVSPAEPGTNQFSVEIVDAQAVASVQVAVTDLGAEREPVAVTLASQGQGSYVAETPALDHAGLWKIDVTVRSRNGGAAAVTFPLLAGSSAVRGVNPDALKMLEQSRAVLAAIRSWRTVEQITDGGGNFVVTAFEGVQPNRLRYRTSTGVEGIVIDSRRYQRQSRGAWLEDRLSASLAVSGPFVQYLDQVEVVALGRKETCETEVCQVVLWDAPGSAASFAGWIGLRTRQLHRLLMVAPSHFMTAELRGANLPIRITPP